MPPIFPSWMDVHRIDVKLDALLREHRIELANEDFIINQENAMSVDLAAIKAKEDAALAAIQANTDALSGIKTALDAKDATIADLTQKLNDAIANGADPVALQAIADEAQAIVDASNNQATAEAALTNTTPVTPPGTPPVVPPVTGAGPVIASLAPTVGVAAGGDTVSINGTNLSGLSGVTFGGVASPSLVADSDSIATVITPPGTGTVDVVVTTAGGVSAPASFTYA